MMDDETYILLVEKMHDDLTKVGKSYQFGSRSILQKALFTADFESYDLLRSRINFTTDWDYAFQDSVEIRQKLQELGFVLYDNLYYKDDLTSCVFYKTYQPDFDPQNLKLYDMATMPVANVVMKTDLDLFKKTWNTVDPKFYINHIWKRSDRYVGMEKKDVKETIRDILNQMFKTANEISNAS